MPLLHNTSEGGLQAWEVCITMPGDNVGAVWLVQCGDYRAGFGVHTCLHPWWSPVCHLTLDYGFCACFGLACTAGTTGRDVLVWWLEEGGGWVGRWVDSREEMMGEG